MMNNFIYETCIDDVSICDGLIDFYHNNNGRHAPVRGETANGIDLQVKNSMDISINVREQDYTPILEKYFLALEKCVNSYKEKYIYCSTGDKFSLYDIVNIQKYNPNGGFYQWHCERSTGAYPYTARHLVFITYLNDVTDEGETEFFYQQCKIKPKKGLTVIFPADWTHTHRGVPSKTQEKYIITGWLNYIT